MNVPNHLILQAKDILGDKAADIIARGMNLEKWDQRNLKGCCPYHKEKTPSFAWNKKKNYFKCFGCGVTVDILDYYQRAGMNFIESIKELFKETSTIYTFDNSDYQVMNKENKPYRYPEPEQNSELYQVEKYLALRKISKATLEYAGVKQDSQGNIVFEYRNQDGKLMLVKYRPSRKLTKSDTKTWCQKEKDTAPLLYGMDKVDTTKPLLICEGEIDRLSAIESGFYNAVSVPFGANNYHWLEYNWDWLEQFEKIIIWSDNDDAGELMRKEVIPRLGEWRCYTVYGKRKDINETLYRDGNESVLELILRAKEVPIKNVVDMAEVEDFDINKAEKIKSGINGLDKYIGGFVLGTVDVITGINGSGKSTFVNQACVCEPLQQGYLTFIFSGELTKAQLRNWIEYPMAGSSFVTEIDNGKNQPKGYYVSKEVKEKMREWYRGKVFFYDNEFDNTAKSLLKKMEEMARKHGVKNFVIDNLMMVEVEGSQYDKFDKQKDFVLDLIRFARRYSAVVHLIAHPRKIEAIRRLTKLDVCGSGDITNLAHYVISVHRVTPKEKEGTRNKKGDYITEPVNYDCLIDLFKNRPIGHQDKCIGVYFSNSSKRFYGDSDEFTTDKPYGWREVQDGFMEVGGDEPCPF